MSGTSGMGGARGGVALIAATVAVAMAAPAAGAAVSVGSSLADPNDTLEGCVGYPCSLVQQTLDSAAGQGTSPIDGVVTSWRYRGGETGSRFALRVLHPNGSAYDAAGVSSGVTVPDDNDAVRPADAARLPIRAGDHLGLRVLTGWAPEFSGTSSTLDGWDSPDLPNGGSAAPNVGSSPGELLIQATVEPDADHDGYGDETQDGCPADPVAHGSMWCHTDLSVSEAPASPTVQFGGNGVWVATVTNNGPSSAPNARVTVALTGAAAFQPPPASSGGCTLLPPAFAGMPPMVQCDAGPLAAGASASVTVAAAYGAPGTFNSDAHVNGQNISDPNYANNSATASLAVLPPPFRGLGIPSQVVNVRRNGNVAIRVTCPPVTFDHCHTDRPGGGLKPGLSLRTAKKFRLRPGARRQRVFLGYRGIFHIAPGARVTLQFKLSRAGRSLLKAHGRLAAIATAFSRDDHDQMKATTGRVQLRLRR